MPKLRPDQLLASLLLLFAGLLIAPTSTAEIYKPPVVQYEPLPLLSETFLFPIKKNDTTPDPILTAKAAIVYDPINGSIIYQKNIHEKLPEASLTKLMTALIASELYDMSEVVTVNNQEWLLESNVMGLKPQENITVESLLKGLLIYSANDAAEALAHHHPEGYEAFLLEMNQKAQALHLDQTSFKNPTGFDDDQHYSTAFDLAVLSKEVLQHELLSEMMQTETTTVSSVDQETVHTLHSTNQLFNKLSGLIGGKTGSTPLAGECLITEVQRNNHTIITVILGSKDRFTDTSNLVDWVYNYYDWQSPVQSEIEIHQL